MKIAVVGAHLRGQPLYGQLSERNARLLAVTRTVAKYKLYALKGTIPAKPGLVRVGEPQAKGIEVEVYEMDPANYASFVDLIPPPMALGNLELDTGETVKGFIVEGYATEGATEITEFGGWRSYLKSIG
ncbi:MAG: hypothetical protein H7144_06095 [Burkholderiales bacterium]|nr:hypothetical protein [Phycisphaerae bacterium]